MQGTIPNRLCKTELRHVFPPGDINLIMHSGLAQNTKEHRVKYINTQNIKGAMDTHGYKCSVLVVG